MAAVSKRQQARIERDLQDLIRSVPGNGRCADCQASNPGWASWSLGVFLCMRCASIHRKLGTHISKVKSLSMDTWSTEQLESMRRNGNIAVNKVYNPKNRQPDIPLDADEVDSAMERFIRKKYQEKSLASGKPQPPSRPTAESDIPRPIPDSPENSPPPPLPPKKGHKFFGFGLRASSSAYPLSKHDKKNLPREPRVNSTFRISSENVETPRRRQGASQQMSEDELHSKLAKLRDMGFEDERRNATVLRGLDGNLERTIESLVRIQQATRPTLDEDASRSSVHGAETAYSVPPKAAEPARTPNNPFDQSMPVQSFGLSIGASSAKDPPNTYVSAPNSATMSTNPFDMQSTNASDHGVQQAFQDMQISQPLFPHSTGGYPSKPLPSLDPRFQQSTTPPVPSISQQYGYVASPMAVNNTNPFFQSTLPTPPASSNPYAPHMQNSAQFRSSSSVQNTASYNPFFSQGRGATIPGASHMTSQYGQPQLPSTTSYNPFGIPPSNAPPAQASNPQTSPFSSSQPLEPYLQASEVQHHPFQSQPQLQTHVQPPLKLEHENSYPNLQYGQITQQSQPQHQSVNPQQQFFQSQPQHQFSYASQQQQPLQSQRTGRFDKSSILALYNYPQLAPHPLASVPEQGGNGLPPQQQPPTAETTYFQPQPDQFGSSASTLQSPQGKRAVTMPLSPSNGSSRNPFFNMSAPQPASSTQSAGPSSTPAYGQGIGVRHASAESMSINNAAFESGRHSPDAFASLSAKYMR